jgi:hypothetical protein
MVVSAAAARTCLYFIANKLVVSASSTSKVVLQLAHRVLVWHPLACINRRCYVLAHKHIRIYLAACACIAAWLNHVG